MCKNLGGLRKCSLNAEDAKDNAEERRMISPRSSAKTSAASALKVRCPALVAALPRWVHPRSKVLSSFGADAVLAVEYPSSLPARSDNEVRMIVFPLRVPQDSDALASLDLTQRRSWPRVVGELSGCVVLALPKRCVVGDHYHG